MLELRKRHGSATSRLAQPEDSRRGRFRIQRMEIQIRENFGEPSYVSHIEGEEDICIYGICHKNTFYLTG